MNVFGAFALFALVTTMVSGLSYHFFEMPANQLIRSKFGSAGGAVEREPLNPSLTVSRI
jgi:peptidoglycan/LPS O-acetylase OafA/YrhL